MQLYGGPLAQSCRSYTKVSPGSSSSTPSLSKYQENPVETKFSVKKSLTSHEKKTKTRVEHITLAFHQMGAWKTIVAAHSHQQSPKTTQFPEETVLVNNPPLSASKKHQNHEEGNGQPWPLRILKKLVTAKVGIALRIA